MRYTAHQGFCLAGTVGALSIMHHGMPSFSPSYTHVIASLLACGLVDNDILLFPHDHRVSSPFHKIEFSLTVMLCGSLFKLPLVFFLGYGFLMHLAMDFIQGGVGSVFTKKRVGLAFLSWKRYDTFLGRILDMVLTLFGLVVFFSHLGMFPEEPFSLVWIGSIVGVLFARSCKAFSGYVILVSVAFLFLNHFLFPGMLF